MSSSQDEHRVPLKRLISVCVYINRVASMCFQFHFPLCLLLDDFQQPLPPSATVTFSKVRARTPASTRPRKANLLDNLAMRSVLGFLVALSTLIPAGHSLSCTKCQEIGANTCNGPTTTCPSDHVCGAMYNLISTRGVETPIAYSRDCFPRKQCDLEGYMNLLANIKSQIGISCCDTDGCTPPLPKLPTVSSKLNGLVCRGCASTTSDWCHTEDTVQCSGNETMCVLGTTITTGARSSKAAVRGCATKSICDIGTVSVEDKYVKIKTKFVCTNGIPGIRGGFVLSFSVAILLTKLLS